MKLGISGFAWTSRFEERHLRLASTVKEMGFDGFEVAMFDPHDLPIAEIRRAFEAVDLERTVCAILPPGINPISPDQEVRKESIQHVIRCVEATAELGARLIGGPLYAPIGYLPEHRPAEEEWEWAVEAFEKVGEALDRCRVELSIEPVNRSETFFIRTAEDGKELCERVKHPRIGVTIDTFHANIEERGIPKAIELLGPYLKHIHASENDRGVLGRGHIDFREIIAALLKIGYDGYLVIEGFGFSTDEQFGPGVLWADKNLSPEHLASRSADYLRAQLGDR
jgi:D-psicose/D-tagatose/L-ribulose 3-epimerase